MPQQNGWTPVAEPKGWTLLEPAKTEPERTWGDTALDVAKGAGKGLLHSGIDLAQTAAKSGMVPGLSSNSLPDPVIDKARDVTAHTNTAQRVGGALETAAEMALPVLKGASAIPRMGRAGAALQDVTAAAKGVPLDLSKTGDVALRIQQLAGRGGTEPRMVRQLLARATDPTKGPVNFEEGRDFYSNISRLSGDEFNRLTGPIKREVGNLRTALNESLTGGAEQVGKGEQYTKGMNEYRQAVKLKDFAGDVASGIGTTAKKSLPFGALGAGGYAAKKLYDLLLGGQ
jgi:hypothetical protein